MLSTTATTSTSYLVLLLLQALSVLPTLSTATPTPAHSNSARSVTRSTVPIGKRGVAVPLRVRSPQEEAGVEKRGSSNVDLLVKWKNKIGTKYGAVEGDAEVVKRAGSDSETLTDLNTDGSYSVSLSIGTPAQTFLANLDTGSADFWLISSACTLCGSTYSEYTTSDSSSYVKGTLSFNISYGSGTASGYLGTDEVTIGDFTVAKQTLGVVTSMSSGLVTNPNSGLMGMGFQGLAISGATPWWQTLATDGVWSEGLFGVTLARYRDVADATSTESAGGTVTFGYTDSSLYSGDIVYTSVTTGTTGYWNIPIDAVTSQGTSISLSASAAAIDTGTTLIGGPATDVAAIYAAISGSVALTGSLAGYYGYPCSTDISLTFTFGTFTGTVEENDFNIGTYSSDTTMCIGGVYAVSLSSSSPVKWVLGDVFLKNVYSVYRYDPAAVGFAALPGVVASSSTSASTTIPVATTFATASFASAANVTSAVTSTKSSSSATQAIATVYSTATPSSTSTSASIATVTSAVHVSSNASSSSTSAAQSSIKYGRYSILGSLVALVGATMMLL